MGGKTNTKKKMLVKSKLRKKTVRKGKDIKRKSKSLLEVSDLGVCSEHVLSSSIFRDPAPMPKTALADASKFLNKPTVDNVIGREIFHRPLTSARVSFWLGVGFGMLVVGTLAILAWQLIRLDLIETVVVGLTR